MSEFRAVPERDRERFQEILRYAFAAHRGPERDVEDDEWPPTLFDPRGLYESGRLVSTCKLYTLEAQVRGEFQSVGGLGAVATAPEDRNSGYSRAICQNATAEYRENDVGFVTLWPFSTAFYRNLGWGVANEIARYEFSPDVLPRYDVPGQMSRLDADDWERLRRVETSYGDGIGLFLRRSEQWWRERTLANWTGRGEPYCYGYERDGTLAGYLVYTVEDGEETTLSVTNMAYADEKAHRGLLDFLGGHGAQIEQITLGRPATGDLLDRVSHPSRVDCQVRSGPMVRLTAVSALEGLSWPAIDLEWTMAVSDPLVEANDDRFAVSVTDGEMTVECGVDSEPDISVGIATLSRLTVGSIDVETASRLGKLDFETESIRESLRDVFTKDEIYLQEFF